MTTSGNVTLFDVTPGSAPNAITGGPDGNVWFTENGHIGRITTSGGSYDRFPIPTAGSYYVDAITVGPDGNLWFSSTSAKKIGVCTVSGAITERDPPTSADIRSIALGPGGMLWFLESGLTKTFVVRLTANGTYTEFPIPTDNANPQTIAAGADGNMWFTEGSKVGRIRPDGTITEFAISAGPTTIAQGPDGNMWLTAGSANDPNLVRVTPNGAFTMFPTAAVPIDLTKGPDGNIWFTTFLSASLQRFVVP